MILQEFLTSGGNLFLGQTLYFQTKNSFPPRHLAHNELNFSVRIMHVPVIWSFSCTLECLIVGGVNSRGGLNYTFIKVLKNNKKKVDFLGCCGLFFNQRLIL